ncbi:MAG: 1-deoxy-D-xylulose-5-phosphate synthase [Bacteroidaceae bacterium]|nr:1-deoxy-D-xylulose-5-phosphate synthase [Bacteroidaceae bacterium]
MSLFKKIQYPADLRKLKVEDLPQLCDELRDDIVKELSNNPGHFASSLGAIEITVAMHYVFNTPEDRIVWDVGHQAYGHKILTGRKDRFSTNRKLGGLRPFPSPLESEYDTFTCGHASNSISAALGMSVADKFSSKSVNKRPRNVIALIGDGAMSGGLAFEGLNNVSVTPNNLLIILNDNNMSIDKSVGAMKEYLKQLNTNKTYNNIKFKVSSWLRNRGHLGESGRNRILRFSNALKSAISGHQNIFEGLNIRYFGPFDGHNVKELVRILTQLKNMEGPRLLHIHTQKGHGYEPAEIDPSLWHAPGYFDADTGELRGKKSKLTKYQDVFGETLLELARSEERIVGITPAMPSGCSMNIMQREIPERVFDVGIAEGHAVTFSAGLAKEGMLPFCNIYSSFAQRAIDNIIHDVAILSLPVVMCFDRAGLVGEDGATHHGVYDMVFMRAIPNFVICAPMDEIELRNMMYTPMQLFLRGNGTSWAIRYPRGCGVVEDWRKPFEEIEIGKGRKIKDGERIAVLSIGNIGNNVSASIKEYEAECPFCKVAHYDMRFLKPLDTTIIDEAMDRYETILTVEDGCKSGGFGSAVLEYMSARCSETGKKMPQVKILGIDDMFIEHGTVAELQRICGIDVISIKETLFAMSTK